MKSKNMVKVQLVKSPLKCLPRHKQTLKGLGLRRLNQTVQVEKNACTLGMINQINYLLKVEELV